MEMSAAMSFQNRWSPGFGFWVDAVTTAQRQYDAAGRSDPLGTRAVAYCRPEIYDILVYDELLQR